MLSKLVTDKHLQKQVDEFYDDETSPQTDLEDKWQLLLESEQEYESWVKLIENTIYKESLLINMRLLATVRSLEKQLDTVKPQLRRKEFMISSM